MRHIVHAFKYEGRRALAEPLAAVMREAGDSVLADADAVVPVPLSNRRALTRGFNQADDLARLLGPPVWRLLRRRHGPPQAGLSAAERAANVRNVYALSWRARIPLAPPIRGSTVVLIDDVMTTGATLEACAAVLMTAGARRVRALTAGRAVTAAPT
jgi:ComF family protein